MYCRNWGTEIDDNAGVCVHCGTPTDNFTTSTVSNDKPKETNVLAIVGFVFSFLVALVGLICSILGYRKAKQEGLEYGGLALAGIIISAVSMALAFLWVLWICLFLTV